jgi:hypothetical protein
MRPVKHRAGQEESVFRRYCLGHSGVSMPEFVVFVVAASMCVLCFAVGFIAALNLRIAERTTLPLIGGLRRSDDAALPPAEAVQQPTVATTSFAPPVPATPAPAPAPATPAPAISLPQAERTFAQQVNVPPRPAAPAPLPQRTHAGQPVGFPPPAAPPAKVFLFGEPHAEPVVVPSLPPGYAASQPSAWGTPQHAAPQPLPPAQVELLPHRPQHARSAHRR